MEISYRDSANLTQKLLSLKDRVTWDNIYNL